MINYFLQKMQENPSHQAFLASGFSASYEELVKRLRNRQTETEEDFQKRIERAKMELSHKDQFDYIISNEYLDKAVEETSVLIKKIVNKEK